LKVPFQWARSSWQSS